MRDGGLITKCVQCCLSFVTINDTLRARKNDYYVINAVKQMSWKDLSNIENLIHLGHSLVKLAEAYK